MNASGPSQGSALLRSELDRRLPTVSHARGVFLWDSDGRRYLDAASGSIAAVLGHAHPKAIDALQAQAAKVSHVYRGSFTSEPTEELARMLVRRSPAPVQRVQFANSGSEAVEIAVKMAIQYWQERGRPEKWKVISRLHSYHGNTLGALSLSGHARRSRFEKLLHPFPMVKAPDPFDVTAVEDFERALLETGADSVAAIIVEPIVGASNPALVPPPGYHERLREICDAHDVLLIADEVMSGMHRSGTFLAMEESTVTADITTLGKGLGGGYVPLSAILVSERVVQGFERGSRKLETGGHTYAANPLATAVGVSVLEAIDEGDLGQNAVDRGQELLQGLARLEAAHPVVESARGRGLLCGLVLDDRLVSDAARELVDAAADVGLMIYLAGDGEINGVLVAPPLIVAAEHIQEIIVLLDAALSAIESR
ncbi:MAG: Adenosylmethionine-8-amino-7-oxononanoate aminotransferase [Naasia sp.]|nr:Adenosylmethionine-8-amino-7-oxononanoate aminotransferase [Naasia sp.]